METSWYPSPENKSILGKFMDHKVLDPVKSREENGPMYKTVVVCQERVAGHSDISPAIRLKTDRDKRKFMERHPEAWDEYQSFKGDDVPFEKIKEENDSGEGRISIYEFDGVPKTKKEVVISTGIMYVDQLAEISDEVCDKLGTHADKWRDRAQKFLAGQKPEDE